MVLKYKKRLANFIRILKFYRECITDGSRYLKYAKVVGSGQDLHQGVLESDIIRRYHVIEKGLAMPKFRAEFGVEMVTQLYSMLLEWSRLYSFHVQVAAAWRVLEAYKCKHDELGVDVSELFNGAFVIPDEYRSLGVGGVKPYRHPNKNDGEVFLRVMASRSSVRNFKVDGGAHSELIRESVKAAISTPSVCNRQAWRVRVYDGKTAQSILALQNGNRGFGHAIPTVCLITVDMSYFVGSYERYQPWIDGGMFSMSLLLALHAKGLGAVPLNWAVDHSQDDKLKACVKIPLQERIIMMIGCGEFEDGIEVPESCRRDLKEVFCQEVK